MFIVLNELTEVLLQGEAVSKVKLNQDNRGGSAVSHDGWP